MIPNDDQLDLVQRYLDGFATEDDVRTLERVLMADPRLRANFLAYARIDSNLSTIVRRQVGCPGAFSPVPTLLERRRASISGRPLTAAAAALFIGFLSASVVWAVALPRLSEPADVVVPLLDDGFEMSGQLPGRGFPKGAGFWSGDLSPSLEQENGITPRSGRGMTRLEPQAKRKFSYAWRIVDLAALPAAPANGVRRVEVDVSFRAPASIETMRDQIRLAAFAEPPEEVKPLWASDELFDWVLQHAARTETIKHGADASWHTLTASMEIPPHARSLVISLAAATPDDSAAKSAFYLDDFSARFVVRTLHP